ncbi:unnamed protein product [Ectocarpus sp. 6 AP-2014]
MSRRQPYPWEHFPKCSPCGLQVLAADISQKFRLLWAAHERPNCRLQHAHHGLAAFDGLHLVGCPWATVYLRGESTIDGLWPLAAHDRLPTTKAAQQRLPNKGCPWAPHVLLT